MRRGELRPAQQRGGLRAPHRQNGPRWGEGRCLHSLDRFRDGTRRLYHEGDEEVRADDTSGPQGNLRRGRQQTQRPVGRKVLGRRWRLGRRPILVDQLNQVFSSWLHDWLRLRLRVRVRQGHTQREIRDWMVGDRGRSVEEAEETGG